MSFNKNPRFMNNPEMSRKLSNGTLHHGECCHEGLVAKQEFCIQYFRIEYSIQYIIQYFFQKWLYWYWIFNIFGGWYRDSESVVFNSGQKMAVRAFNLIRALTKALTCYYIKRFQCHLLAAIENNRLGGPIDQSWPRARSRSLSKIEIVIPIPIAIWKKIGDPIAIVASRSRDLLSDLLLFGILIQPDTKMAK